MTYLRTLSRERRVQLVLALTLLAALAARITIERPTLIAERQYRSMLIARSYYFRAEPAIPEWRKVVAEAAVARVGVLEPPFFEWLVSRAYRVVGRETLRIPGLLASAFWLAGGLLLFRIALRFSGPGAAWLITCYYLFLPLGIEVSTIFLPESPMMAAYLLGLLLILRHDEAPTVPRLLAAALASGVAILVKPLCLFALLGAFAGLWLSRAMRDRSPSYRTALVFFSIALSIGTAYYAYGLFFSDLMAEKAGKTFFPHLLLTSEFWIEWPAAVLDALGLIPVMLALLGLAALGRNVPRGLVFGLLASYPIFLATFAYHVRFADYYHLQLLPAVALAATPVLAGVMRHLREALGRSRAVPALLMVLAVAWFGVFGELRSRQASRKPIEPRHVAREIGDLVGHSTRVVFVSPYYGTPLTYNGEMAGAFWRRAARSEESWQPDLGPPGVLERFAELDLAVEYVVVTDLQEFGQHHADLRAFLEARCDLVGRTEAYLVYRLQNCVPHYSDPGGRRGGAGG